MAERIKLKSKNPSKGAEEQHASTKQVDEDKATESHPDNREHVAIKRKKLGKKEHD
jgi:hypothetical protein